MFRNHRRRWILAIVVVLAALITATLVALPEIVRRVAVSRLTTATGRTVSIEDVDLNLFTGRLALKGFRLAHRASPEPALEIRRLDLGIAQLSLLRKTVRVTDVSVITPVIHLARTGPGKFDFSDLIALIPPADPKKPSTRTVTLDRVAIRDLSVVARDLVPSPPMRWTLEGFNLDATALSTEVTAAPGRLTLKGRLNGATFALDASTVALAKGAVTARLTLDDVALPLVAPYVPPEIAVLPKAGTLALALTVGVESPDDGAQRVVLDGDVRVNGLALVPRERSEPFLSATRVTVAIKRADLGARTVALGPVEVAGLALAATHNRAGEIDLVRLAAPSAPSAPSPAPAAGAAPPPRPMTVSVERIALIDAAVTLTDEAVTPVTRLKIAPLAAIIQDVTWPATKPAVVDTAMALPTAGRLTVKGAVTPSPFDADLTLSLRDGSIDPYAAYFPFKARFSGSFNGDSRWRVRLVDGKILATSTGGNSWIDNLSATPGDAPADTPPLVRGDRLALAGIDFDWPKYARAKRVTITRPDVRVEREKDGSISLNRIFTANEAPADGKTPAPAPPPAASGGSTLPITLEIGAIVVDEGLVRVVDRTIDPPYSESISRLAITVDGLSSVPGKRANLTAKAVIGASGDVDVKGVVAPFGRFFADFGVEVRDFALPAITPYVDDLTAWSIQRGTLVAHLHYTIDGDQLTSQNELTVGDLEVAPAGEDRTKDKLGLPLGTIVALIKDSQGRIQMNVPVTGPLNDPKFDFSEAIGAAVRNVVSNVVAAPFRAIGRLFKSDDNKIEKLTVEPVVFAPGSATITPEMERHLLKVAEFLKGAPGVTMRLASATTAKDVTAIKTEAVNARLKARLAERKLDHPAAVAAEFTARFPQVKPLPSTDEQLARLVETEPVPEARIAELRARRLAVVKDALIARGGIPETRLAADDAAAGGETGEGRVEFRVGA
jgi:hypothetical protein